MQSRKNKRYGIKGYALTAVILSLINLTVLINTTKNIIVFQSTKNTFRYEVTDVNKIELYVSDSKAASLIFGETNVEIIDAYRFDDIKERVIIMAFIRYYCKQTDKEIKRSDSDVSGEYILHTIAYRVGINIGNSCNANIDYISDNRWYVRVAGSIFGWLGI